MTGTMLAITQPAYGGTEVLDLRRFPHPEPGSGEVLLRVRAAGIDRGTWHLLTGLPRMVRLAMGLRRPRRAVPGLDVAGTVVAVGPGVTRLEAGQEVSGLTALQALDAARVADGHRVLVIGASGGVGSLAVKLAVARGARVTAVCSAAKADAVRSWGATDVVDYAATDSLDTDARYDAIVDIAGGAPLRRLRRAVTPTGSIVFVGAETGGAWTGGFGRPMRDALRMLAARQRYVMLVSSESHEDLARLAGAVERDGLRPHVDATYPLARTAEALDRLAAGAVTGKVAILVDEPDGR